MNILRSKLRRSTAAAGLALMVTLAAPAGPVGVSGPAWAQETPTLAQTSGAQPGVDVAPANNLSNALGGVSDTDIWREIRGGMQGGVSLPDVSAGLMIQSEGDSWRAIRNGPVSNWGWWGLAAVCALIAFFFCFRGRVTIDSGLSGRTMQRFNALERFAHWLTAGSFVVLALTGLNILYGRYLFAMDSAGDTGAFGGLHTFFATITYWGKFAHNYLGFAFAVGVVLCFVLWVRHNLPDKYDAVWLSRGGGLFGKGNHPPSAKFNAGQKILFWVVILSGVALFVTGLSMLFPFYWFGLQDMQLVNLIHVIVSLVAIAVILGHIYIGSIGMQGAFDAMGTGEVDENWAREHHSVWVAEVKGEPIPDVDSGSAGQPAE